MPRVGLDTSPKKRARHLVADEPECKHGPREQQALRRHDEGDYDKTDLDSKSHGKMVHRDYAAHYFRWGWAANFCSKKRVLDYGCGKEQPLARVLTDFNYPSLYLGLDLNKLDEWSAPWKKVKAGVDLCAAGTPPMIIKDYGKFDVGVSFEVIEHVPFDKQEVYLKNLSKCVSDDGMILLSTPVYSPGKGMAKNHMSELMVDEIFSLAEICGLEVVNRYGTFADYTSWKNALKNSLSSEAWDELWPILQNVGEFYSTTVQSNWWAPAFPDISRNNAWIFKKKD